VEGETEILAFRVTGEFAHFRSPFVTSYLSTYPFPPKPTVLGMIGAMMGYSPIDVLKKLQDSVKIAIKLNKPLKKALDYTRLWKFEDKNIIPSPTKVELLVRPDYTIFVYSQNDEFLKELQNKLETRDFVYPISLGKNEFIAFIRDIFQFGPNEIEAINANTVDSILPVIIDDQKIAFPDFTTSNWATVGLVPVELELVSETGTRRVKKTGTFAYSIDTRPLKLQREVNALKVGSWSILMF